MHLFCMVSSPTGHKLYFFLAIPFRLPNGAIVPKAHYDIYDLLHPNKYLSRIPAYHIRIFINGLYISLNSAWFKLLVRQKLVISLSHFMAILWHSLILLQNSEKFSMIDIAVSPKLIRRRLAEMVKYAVLDPGFLTPQMQIMWHKPHQCIRKRIKRTRKPTN